VGPGALLAGGIPVVRCARSGRAAGPFYCRTFWRASKPVTLNDDLLGLWKARSASTTLFGAGRSPVARRHAAASCARGRSSAPDAIYFINFSTAKRGGVLHPWSGFTLSVSQLQVESRGSVRIKSADPRASPAIRYNYLAAENDRRVMVEGLKIIRRIAAASPLAGYIVREEFPGPRAQSDEELLAVCRESGESVFHPTSTCRMGTDAASVVDSQLRVRAGGSQGGGCLSDAKLVSSNTSRRVAIAERLPTDRQSPIIAPQGSDGRSARTNPSRPAAGGGAGVNPSISPCARSTRRVRLGPRAQPLHALAKHDRILGLSRERSLKAWQRPSAGGLPGLPLPPSARRAAASPQYDYRYRDRGNWRWARTALRSATEGKCRAHGRLNRRHH
jgi:hypothetical protein